MGSCMDRLLREADEQAKQLRQSEEIVLYGKTDLLSVLRLSLRELGFTASQRVFDSGRFADCGTADPSVRRCVVLCGMRAATRESMRRDASVLFPAAPCFDCFPIYFLWLLERRKRGCDPEELAKTLFAVRAERTIHNIDSINTSQCSLNCRECSNGMQLRQEKKLVPLERHIGSLNRLTAMRPISYCNLQGGEPLLDGELPERIALHAQNPRIAFLTLATNGTIVASDAVMDALHDAGAMIRISDYGPLSAQKQKLTRKAEQFLVPCDVYRRSEFWVAYGAFAPRGRTEAENRRAADSCHFGTKCLMLYDGRLYCCCRTLFADALGAENDATRANTLNLTEPFSEESLDAIVYGTRLHLMCDYCDFPMRVIPAAEQTQRRMIRSERFCQL